ncbi:MAG: GGDEF domain-containing protein [Actinomycetota bacterium]
MGRRIASACALVVLLAGALSSPAAAQTEIEYLDAVELLHDPATDTLIDPESGAEFTHPRFSTDDILEFQARVDENRWEVPDFLADEALAFLLDEIALLMALDAIAPNPELDRIDAHYRAALDELDRDTLIAGLEEVDQILDQIKGEILQTGAVIPDAPARALGDLDPDWRRRIAAGDQVPFGPYMSGMSALISRGTAAGMPREMLGIEFVGIDGKLDLLTFPEGLADFARTAPVVGFDVQIPAPVGGIRTDTAAEPPADPAPVTGAAPDGGGLPGWLLAVATLALASAVVGGVVVLRRRNRGSQLDDDALRGLIDADTEGRVAAIACSEAVGATGARRAVLARPAGGGLRQIGTSTTVVGSALQRVVETGTPLDQTITDDPLLGARPQIALAVPVVSNGSVVGVLAITRDNGSFGAEARPDLERLAPSVGAALANVDRLGSVARLALVDELTKLGNRRRLDHDLEETVRAAAVDGTPVAFAMLDVDHFKQFNDTHGHAAGDRALQAVADVIAMNVREGDVVYRYGGEEFSILLPNASPDEAADVAERVREAVEGATIEGEETQPGGTLTISVGVSSLPAPGPAAMAQRADEALYHAKQNGRNRVVTDPVDVS